MGGTLDDGPAKDQALTTLVQRGRGSLDDMLPIINEIQTPERRSHAVLMAAMQLSRSDMEGARTLLRRYPLDPARQRQFDEFPAAARPGRELRRIPGLLNAGGHPTRDGGRHAAFLLRADDLVQLTDEKVCRRSPIMVYAQSSICAGLAKSQRGRIRWRA